MFPIIVVGTTGALILLIIYVAGYPIAKLMLRNNAWYKKAKEDLRTKGRASIAVSRSPPRAPEEAGARAAVAAAFPEEAGHPAAVALPEVGDEVLIINFSGKALDNSLCDMYFDNHSQLGGNV